MIHLLLMGAAFYFLLRENPTVKRIDEALDDWETDDDEDWDESDFRITTSLSTYEMTTAI